MPTNDELLAKLDRWSRQRENEPTFFELVESGDGELVAAYVLKKFRTAAQKTAIGSEDTWLGKYPSPEMAGTARLLQAFDILSAQWDLSRTEKLGLLGLDDAEGQRRLRATPIDELPIEVIERIATLVSIASILRSLLPQRSSAYGWTKRVNNAPLFAGRTALDFMIKKGPEGLRRVHSFLLAELYGN
jgi:hypothetical protein